MNHNFNNSPININEQGTSPLTVGGIDQTPLAIAFQETIHVMISGDNQEKYEKINNYFFFLRIFSLVGKVELLVKCLFHFQAQY
jgi:hypothetical protein